MKSHVIVILCATHMHEDNNIVTINTKTTAGADDIRPGRLSHILAYLPVIGHLIVYYFAVVIRGARQPRRE